MSRVADKSLCTLGLPARTHVRNDAVKLSCVSGAGLQLGAVRTRPDCLRAALTRVP